MIVDSSALVAMIHYEPDHITLKEKLTGSKTLPKMSAANYFETAIVIDGGRNPLLSKALDKLVDDLEIKIVDVTVAQAKIAREAYQLFGKGSGHKAQLNFGDCFAYALASDTREPLLFKGNDFRETDIDVA
jgi:ribonuclease VapC